MYKNFEHLSNEEISALIDKYYSENIIVKDLLKEYNLSIPASKLHKSFPPLVYENYICEYCNIPLVADRKSKSNNLYYKNDLYCINCSHKPYIQNCNCNKCNEKQKKIISMKQKEIYNVYTKREDPINFEDLSFEGKVFLGTFIEYAIKENMYEFECSNKIQKIYDLAPDDKTKSEIINFLIHNKAIQVSPFSNISAFTDNNFPKEYDIYNVMYTLNLELPHDKEELLNQILQPDYFNDEYKKEALTIWKKIAISECIEYLVYQLKQVGFDFEVGEKTYITFEAFLENYSVAQIYGVIWRSVSEASRLYLEKRMTKKHAANTTIGSCQRYIERAQLYNWTLKEYSRLRDLPQSELSRFFFNKVTKIGELGFTMPPTNL